MPPSRRWELTFCLTENSMHAGSPRNTRCGSHWQPWCLKGKLKAEEQQQAELKQGAQVAKESGHRARVLWFPCTPAPKLPHQVRPLSPFSGDWGQKGCGWAWPHRQRKRPSPALWGRNTRICQQALCPCSFLSNSTWISARRPLFTQDSKHLNRCLSRQRRRPCMDDWKNIKEISSQLRCESSVQKKIAIRNLLIVSLQHTCGEHQFYHVHKGDCDTRSSQSPEGLNDLILLVAPPAAALRGSPGTSCSSLSVCKVGTPHSSAGTNQMMSQIQGPTVNSAHCFWWGAEGG